MKKENIKIAALVILLLVIFYLILLYVFGIKSIIVYIVGIPIVILLFFICKFIAYLFKKKKYIPGIISIIGVIVINTFIFGIILFATGVTLEGVYNVEAVKVVDSSLSSVTVDLTPYNHGDYRELTIRKPIFVSLDKGDIIDVRYPINEINKMKFVLNSDVGLKLMGISMFLMEITIFVGIICSVIYLIVRKRKENRNGKE